MANVFSQSFSDVSFWFKNKSGEPFTLGDVVEIIPLRYQYFLENWNFIKEGIKSSSEEFEFSDSLKTQIKEFDNFITIQSNSSISINPFEKEGTVNQYLSIFNNVLANSFKIKPRNIDPFALARTNANNPDIEINTGLSGRLVKINENDDMSTIAYRYLGDEDRWMEIAIANGLKPPYIDNIGTDIFLLTNGGENRVNISGNGLDNDIHVGQIVFLFSDTLRQPEQRFVLSVEKKQISNEVVIELDGDPDLFKYKTIDNAQIRIFKPNTINSYQLILIPSPQPVQSAINNNEPFFLKTSAQDEKQSLIDLSLDDETNDLSFTSFSDLRLSYGLENATQAMKLKVVVEEGELISFPRFGLPSIIGSGTGTTEESRQQIITGIVDMVARDNRFSQLQSLDVQPITTGGASGFNISIKVKMAGTGSLIPITFSINT
jgi:hypothetical protein